MTGTVYFVVALLVLVLRIGDLSVMRQAAGSTLWNRHRSGKERSAADGPVHIRGSGVIR
ncbi:MAG TPA: hypothetical protein VN577_00770 [Terriglobales bacterium]|nr:hypothetical protein [Terriglobales bacterium]